MTTYKIEAPVRSFTGESVGVHFHKGTGHVDDTTKDGRAALEYFRRHGYGVALADDLTEEERAQELVTGTPAQREALSPTEAMTNLGHGSAPSVGLGIGIPDTPAIPPTPVTAAGFDPGKASQDEVLAYLDQADDNEVQRVKGAEAAGRNRKQIAAYERKTTPTPANDAKGQSA